MECWGSDESWDLWREESEGGRKKNTQSMETTQEQTRAKQYPANNLSKRGGVGRRVALAPLWTIQVAWLLNRKCIRSLTLKHSPVTAQSKPHYVSVQGHFYFMSTWCYYVIVWAFVLVIMTLSSPVICVWCKTEMKNYNSGYMRPGFPFAPL